jgi:hypothetical protein
VVAGEVRFVADAGQLVSGGGGERAGSDVGWVVSSSR